MNRAERRAANKILHLDKGQGSFGEDACRLCTFLNVQVVGGHQQEYVDAQGRVIELGVMPRVEPPQGFRFPKLLASRPPCELCNGEGQTSSSFIKDGEIVRQRNMCKPCMGTGRQLKGDEFAQLCAQCAQYLMAWLQARAQAHAQKHAPAGGRIVVASPAQLAAELTGRAMVQQRAPGLFKVALPGIER